MLDFWVFFLSAFNFFLLIFFLFFFYLVSLSSMASDGEVSIDEAHRSERPYQLMGCSPMEEEAAGGSADTPWKHKL